MSDKWVEVIEDGTVYWVHEELGNVIKLNDFSYVSCMAKIVKLGPFNTLDEAKKSLSENKNAIDNVLENFNEELLSSKKEK